MQCLSLQSAIKIMESGKPFSLRVVSLDVKRKTGGQVKFYAELIKPQLENSPSEIHPENGSTSRDPSHHQNMTRNYYHAINGRSTSTIIKVHLYGILEVNNINVAL